MPRLRTSLAPPTRRSKPGATFTCTVSFSDGKHAIVTLKIRNKDADISIVGLKQQK